MITEKDLQEAIAECQGKRKPNAETVKLLAACYIVQEHMYGNSSAFAENATSTYSYAAPSTMSEFIVDYRSDTEFGQTINGMESSEAWALVDELMTTLYAVNKPLYDSVMRRLK